MTRTIITAAAIALIAGPTLAQTMDQSAMLRSSVSQSLSGMGVQRDGVSDLSLIQLTTLRHIVEGGNSEGQKAFRARSFLNRTGK